MDNYRLSDDAGEDIDYLFSDGIIRYGFERATQYFNGLIKQFEFLSSNVNIGINSDELSPNLQRFSYNRHVIFYMKTDTGILIVRVLGEEMDFYRHLEIRDVNFNENDGE